MCVGLRSREDSASLALGPRPEQASDIELSIELEWFHLLPPGSETLPIDRIRH